MLNIDYISLWKDWSNLTLKIFLYKKGLLMVKKRIWHKPIFDNSFQLYLVASDEIINKAEYLSSLSCHTGYQIL